MATIVKSGGTDGFYLINTETFPGRTFDDIVRDVRALFAGAQCEALQVEGLIRVRPREITTLEKFRDKVSGVAGIDPDKVCPPTPPGWKPPESKEEDTT